MRPITVIPMDDHPLVRQGIRSLLASSPEVQLIAEGWAGEQLLPLVEEHGPDVVLLDLGMPYKADTSLRRAGMAFRAFPVIARLNKAYPATHVIIVSQYASRALVEGALDAGVRGYLLKDDALCTHLVEAIRAVHRGAHYLSQEVSQLLLEPSLGSTLLTDRQKEVLRAIAVHPELSYADHARRLNISEHTFSNHLRQVFERLDVGNVTAALVRAIQLGLVPMSLPDLVPGAAEGGPERPVFRS